MTLDAAEIQTDPSRSALSQIKWGRVDTVLKHICRLLTTYVSSLPSTYLQWRREGKASKGRFWTQPVFLGDLN